LRAKKRLNEFIEHKDILS